ncbi:DUF6998 domain-containing protein [Pseudomonas knackmussii]|uniref:DUF6998 domain-containing protein n=1 Tax=Pseudomonas knackmussii TaxID=65741 RepID=UPI003F4A2BA1
MDSVRFPEIIRQIYSLVSELETMFEGRHFTPDGHMVGSIGEALAAHYYGLQLLTASTKGHDALKDGKKIEIKATQGSSAAFRSKPEHALVIKIHRDGSFSEIYNGPGELIWAQFSEKKIPSNGQFQISLNKLKELNLLVAEKDRIQRVLT